MEGRSPGRSGVVPSDTGIKGYIPVSMVDWKETLSAVVFFGDCNFRCPYCHNPDIVLNKSLPDINFAGIISGLMARRSWIEGVVITGGEPCLSPEIFSFLEELKSLDFRAKLDTNGSLPRVLKKIITNRLVDFIALDLKSLPVNYPSLCGPQADPEKILESLKLVIGSGIEHEIRVTLYPEAVNDSVISALGELAAGCQTFVLQQFNPSKTLSKKAAGIQPFDREVILDWKERLSFKGLNVQVRGVS